MPTECTHAFSDAGSAWQLAYNPPMNDVSHLILIGPMGAGKSELGQRLAQHYGVPFIDIDREIEARTGCSISDLFARDGEADFRRLESAMLAQCLQRPDDAVIATGGGAVLAASNRALLRAHGCVVHLHLDVSGQLQRLAGDQSRPLLARPDRDAVLRTLASERAPLYAEVAHLRFDTAGLDPDIAATRLVQQLNHCWQPPGART